jgi:hypothetical protein
MPNAKKPNAKKKMLQTIFKKDDQTMENRDSKWQICRSLENMWGVFLFKPRILAPADIIAARLFDFKTVAYLDFRFRECQRTTFLNIRAHKEKIDRAVLLATQNRIRYLYCVKFIDGFYVAEIDEKKAAAFPHYQEIYLGRPERTDYEIPTAIFKRAEEIEL